MTPSIINTNNKNLNIKYNERLVKDIRKDEREKTLKEVEKMIDKNTNSFGLIRAMEFKQSLKKLGEKE